jgi:hypothetical protein
MAPEQGMFADGGGGRVYYQLVIRIFKGRMFPLTHDDGGRQIALQARFNGESLATDAVTLCAEPTFNTELVWEFGAAKHRELKEREGSTLRLQCVLAGDEMPQTGARQIGFVMLDLRAHVCGTGAPTIGAVPGRKGSVAPTGKSESRWYQLRGGRQPLPEVKIFVKINCKPVVSLVSGMPASGDFEEGELRGRHQITPNSPNGKRRADCELVGWEASTGGKHGTVVLPPQRLPAGARREPGAWGRYALAVKCKSVTQEQVGVRSTVPLDEGWSLLLGVAGRMYAIHAPENPIDALAPGAAGSEPEAVREVIIAEASSLVDFLERSDGRGGGIAIWLFVDGQQFACGTAGLGELAGAVGRKWKEGQIGTMAASTVLLNTWVPSRMDDCGGSGPGAHLDTNEDMASAVSVELDIDLLGLGSGPEPPVPVPECEQLVPCNLTITIMSLSFDGGLPFGVNTVRVLCRRGSYRRLGEADSTPLHKSQAVRLDAKKGQYLGVGEMFTMAGEWGDLRCVVLEWDLMQADEMASEEERLLLGAGMVDVGAAICGESGKDNLPGVAGAMRVRTVSLVDQSGRAVGRLSVMFACNLSLDFPKGDPDANDLGSPRVPSV